MTLTITLPEALSRRVEAVARAQGRDTDTVIVEALEAAVPVDPDIEAAVKARFGFVGIGASGRHDLAERHDEIRREHFAGRSADES